MPQLSFRPPAAFHMDRTPPYRLIEPPRAMKLPPQKRPPGKRRYDALVNRIALAPRTRTYPYIGTEAALPHGDAELAHTAMGSSGGTRRSAGDGRRRRDIDAAPQGFHPAAGDPGTDRPARER